MMTRRQKNKSPDRTHPSLESILNKLENGDYGHEVEPTIDFLIQLICHYEVALRDAEIKNGIDS